MLEEAHIYLRPWTLGIGQCIASILIVECLLLVLACAAGACIDPHLRLEVTPSAAAAPAATVTTTSPACAAHIKTVNCAVRHGSRVHIAHSLSAWQHRPAGSFNYHLPWLIEA